MTISDFNITHILRIVDSKRGRMVLSCWNNRRPIDKQRKSNLKKKTTVLNYVGYPDVLF